MTTTTERPRGTRELLRLGLGTGLAGAMTLGLPAGLLTTWLLHRAWGYCHDLSPDGLDHWLDRPLVGLDRLPPMLLELAALPVGCLLGAAFVALLVQPRHRPARAVVLTGLAVGLALLLCAVTLDLAQHLALPSGSYLRERCPAGRPPWWPAPLPLSRP